MISHFPPHKNYKKPLESMEEYMARIMKKYADSFAELSRGVETEHCAFDIIDEYTPVSMVCYCSKCSAQ